MLGKLIKHEFRATGRILLPVYLVMLLTAALVRGFQVLTEQTAGEFMRVLAVLSVLLFSAAVFGGSILAFVLMIYRFYKNLMTDEGYLMFTLPVSVHQLLWAKLLVSMLWFVAVFCVDALAILLAIYENGMFAGLPEFVRNVFDSMNRYYAVNGLLYMLELLGVMIVSMVTACLLVYAPISIGNSFATHKTLLSVVFYFVIQTVLQIVTVFGFAFSARTVNDVIMPSLAASPTRAAHLLFLSVLGYSLIIGTILYALTWFMLRKRLNLQ